MKLEEQVVSLELAKRLKELNCKQESLWCWDKDEDIVGGEWYLSQMRHREWNPSAFTVAELGEMLPIRNYAESKKFRDEEVVSTKYYSFYKGETQYSCCLESTNRDYKIVKKEIIADTEANARAKMLIYLKEKKL